MNLLFFDERTEVAERLQEAFQGHAFLSAQQLMPSKIASHEALDAMYSPPMAAERWGVKPMYYQSQVLETHTSNQDWPPFIVTGIFFTHEDVRADDPSEALKLTMNAVLKAVGNFNAQHGSPIKTIGFWTRTLLMHRMDPDTAAQIIRTAYEANATAG